ncbi:MAG: hypothetical protein E7571_06125 [Ruminococcaceae bacterium]|nr:hypothetical protein [Oscillospiraceae bacterium]
MKKGFIIKTVKIISFLLVMAVLLEVLSFTVFSKYAAGTAYRNKMNKTYSFYTEPAETIQVVGVGNSDLYSGFVPTKLFEDYGYTCQLTGSPYQTPLLSYYYLKEMFKTQTPEVVMIEVDMLYDENPGVQVPEETKLDSLFNYADTDDFQAVIANQFAVFTFHDRWKKLNLGKQDLRTPNSHGYKYFTSVGKANLKDYMKKTDVAEQPHKNRLHQFDMLYNLCIDEGAKVFFVEMPTTNSWNYARHNAAVSIAKEYGVEFIDLNLRTDELGLNLKKEFRDKGNHLNYKGACKVTKYLGDYIKNNYNLEDRRTNPDYKFWHDSVKAFKKEMKAEDKRREEED